MATFVRTGAKWRRLGKVLPKERRCLEHNAWEGPCLLLLGIPLFTLQYGGSEDQTWDGCSRRAGMRD